MNRNSAIDFPGEQRLHVGLAVTDVDRSTRFYRTLLGVEPSKERPGYAKFEPAEPSVNLTLNQVEPGSQGRSPATHYGIQVKSTQAVQEAARRFQAAGLEVKVQDDTTCCHAVQDKVWVSDPDGNAWEVFVVVQADAMQTGIESPAKADAAAREVCGDSACSC